MRCTARVSYRWVWCGINSPIWVIPFTVCLAMFLKMVKMLRKRHFRGLPKADFLGEDSLEMVRAFKIGTRLSPFIS
jgi:hypothetical protein